MRIQVAFSPLHSGWIDISFEEFNSLPVAEIPDSDVPEEYRTADPSIH